MATVTVKGIEAIARNLAGVSPLSAFQYIAVGSSNLGEDENQDGLDYEQIGKGLDRALATCEYIGENKIRWSHTFLATDEVLIWEYGVFNDPGTGDMFVRHVLPASITLYSGDELEVIHIHTMEIE